MTDQELIQEIRAGNVASSEKALRQIYISCFTTTKQMILKNSGTSDDAKDLFQDSMIVLYNKIKQDDFKLTSKISTLLYSISRNLWLKKLRDQKKQTKSIDIQDIQIAGSSDIHLDLEFSEDQKMLGELLLKSGTQCMELLKAFYYEKLKMKKIVLLLNYSSEQVAKNQKARCLKKVKALLLSNNKYRESLTSK